LARFDLLRHVLPECAALMGRSPAYVAALRDALSVLDAHANDPSRERSLSLLLAHYLKPFLDCRPDRFIDTPDAYREAVHEAKLFLSPLNPPRVELEAAVLVVFKKRGISPMQRPHRWPAESRGHGEARGRGEPRGNGAPEADIVVPIGMPATLGEAAKRKRRRKRARHKPQGGQAPRAASDD
jgi:poly(A) polymerase